MISKEQVADLRPGDVVEVVRRERFTIDEVTPDGRAYPWIGDGEDTDIESMTVMYRAPRPLYVNHDRTEPRRGDVVRFDPDGEPEDWDNVTWFFNGKEWRQLSNGSAAPICGEMPCGLRLLVDGETGQVVP